MPASFRPVLFAAALATLCSGVVAMVVISASRPPVFISSPAALSSTSGAQAGVITSGDATVSKRPDVALLSVGVQSQQSTAAAAQSDLASKAAKLISRAKSLGVADKDLSTSGYSVNPNYVQPEGTLNGYIASENLQIKWHNVDTVGKALDALVQQGGATQVGVGFGLADPKSAQAEARSLAIADARSRAQAMANAAGIKLGPVVLVSDQFTYRARADLQKSRSRGSPQLQPAPGRADGHSGDSRGRLRDRSLSRSGVGRHLFEPGGVRIQWK